MISLKDIHLHNNATVIPNDYKTYRRHISEIGKFKPLSREEEVETFIKIETGDKAALDKICNHNLRFVVSVARRYSSMLSKSTTVSLEDLISEGNMGLVLAAKKFDYRKGNKFISYAVWWIRQFILASMQHNIKNIRIPSNVRLEIQKIHRCENDLIIKLGRTPSTIEIFEAMVENGEMTTFIERNKINELLKMDSFETSLSDLVGTDSTMELSDMLVDESPDPADILIEKQRKELLMEMLDKLPIMVKNCLIDFYGIDTQPLTPKQLGEKYELTPSRINQIIGKYTNRLKRNNRKVGEFLFPRPDYKQKNELLAYKQKNPDFDRNAIYLF